MQHKTSSYHPALIDAFKALKHKGYSLHDARAQMYQECGTLVTRRDIQAASKEAYS